jgi:hypothetical protein
MNKITLLNLFSTPLLSDDRKPTQGTLYDLNINNGSVEKQQTKYISEYGVELLVEPLKVAIIEDLSTDENSSLNNYDKLTPIDDSGPVIEEVDN